jgi:gliding motility-associated-like protein
MIPLRCFLLVLLFGFFSGRAQICSGTLGAPVFTENFGSGAAVYGPPLPAGVTTYTYQTFTAAGVYTIARNSDPFPHGFVSDHDHTGNTNGYMMLINGSFAADEAYRKHVTGLCPNTTYVFVGYLANHNTPASISSCNPYIYANVKFQAEYPLGTIQGSVTSGNLPLGTTSTNLNWQPYGFVFTTLPGQTSVDVVMKNNAAGGCGNDYVVDDISLAPCGPLVTLSTAPNATVFCAGSTATLQSTFTSGSYTNPQYQWQYSSNNGVTWSDVIGAVSQNYPIPSVAGSNSGLYRLLVSENGNINSANCRIVAGPITFSVAGVVGTPVAVSGNTLLCAGGTATLTATGSATYFWNTGQTSAGITVSPSSTTTYSVSSSQGSCAGPATITVNVVTSPTLSVSGNQNLCAGETSTLSASGANTYSWSNGSSSPTIVVSPLSQTAYSVVGAIGTCTAQAIATLSVTATPVISITGNTVVCAGQPVILTASGAGTYTWNSSITSPTVSTAPSSTTVYTVTGTTGPCTASGMYTVHVLPLPVMVISGTTLLCPGQSTTLTASGASSYTWSNGQISPDNNVTPASTTSYTVTGSDGTCTNTAVSTVSVADFNTSGTNSAICEGEYVTLSGSGAGSYIWSTGSVSPSITIHPLATSAYTLVETIGSCTNSAVFTVSVNPAPNIRVSRDTILCAGTSIVLTASGASSYLWNTGASTFSLSVTPTVTSAYTVTGAVGTCTDQAVTTVSVLPMPIALYDLSPNPMSELTPLAYFTNQSLNYTSWQWDFGDGSAIDSVNVSPWHDYHHSTPGNYLTGLTVTNAYGCKDTKGMILKIEPEFIFYIPNTFTPNNDGLNDLFQGVGIGIVEFDMLIFDRWGKCIYKTNDIQSGWNGKIKDKEPAEQGTYTWKIEIKDILNKNHSYTGHVLLLN